MTRPIDLVCFDVDGTLVSHPRGKVVWEVLNHHFTGDDTVNAERYRQFKSGEITYAQWVELDVQGWIDAGATREQIHAAISDFRRHEGVTETLDRIHGMGKRTAIISGTLDVLIDRMFPQASFDDVYSNRLLFHDDGRLVGWQATPYDQHGKADALRELARRHQVDLANCAFVGDGENDVGVLGVAGMVIAFQPSSETLRRGADVVITENQSMLELLKHIE